VSVVNHFSEIGFKGINNNRYDKSFSYKGSLEPTSKAPYRKSTMIRFEKKVIKKDYDRSTWWKEDEEENKRMR